MLGARYSRLHSYGPLRHPNNPGLSLARFLFELNALLARASRVPPGLLCTHAITTTPANQHTAIVALYVLFLPDTGLFGVPGSLPPISAESAFALPFSRPARCSRMLRPRCSLTPIRSLFLKYLNFHCYL